MGVNSHPGKFPTRKMELVPSVAPDTMREIERSALEDYGLDVLQLMENAGRAAATLALAMLGGAGKHRVVVLAGGGNVGGAGLAALRHLSNAGVVAEPVLGFVEDDDMPPAVRRQLVILQRSGIAEPHDRESSRATLVEHLDHADLVIDALVGYGAGGQLPGLCAAITVEAVAANTPVLSLDGPAGFDCASGAISEPHLNAVTTLSFDLPKQAMTSKQHRAVVGDLYVADIGIPGRAHSRAGVAYNGLYADGPIVRLR